MPITPLERVATLLLMLIGDTELIPARYVPTSKFAATPVSKGETHSSMTRIRYTAYAISTA